MEVFKYRWCQLSPQTSSWYQATRDNETPTQIPLLLLRTEISRKTGQRRHPKLNQRQACELTDTRLPLINAQQKSPLIHGAEPQEHPQQLEATGVSSEQTAHVPPMSIQPKSQPLATLTCVLLPLFWRPVDDFHLPLKQASVEQGEVFCYDNPE